MKKKTVVIQDPQNEVPTEVLAKAILDISAGIRVLRKGRLNDRALVLLIQHAAPRANGQPLPAYTVKDVLQGIEDLEKTFLKAKP